MRFKILEKSDIPRSSEACRKIFYIIFIWNTFLVLMLKWYFHISSLISFWFRTWHSISMFTTQWAIAILAAILVALPLIPYADLTKGTWTRALVPKHGQDCDESDWVESHSFLPGVRHMIRLIKLRTEFWQNHVAHRWRWPRGLPELRVWKFSGTVQTLLTPYWRNGSNYRGHLQRNNVRTNGRSRGRRR